MPRDYAKRGGGRDRRSSAPGWVWMLGGLVVGLFIAFLYYLHQRGGEPVEGITLPKFDLRLPATGTDTRAVKKEPVPTPAPKREGINFDFYHILPEQEVVIPEAELAKGEGAEERATYYLQVGSFKSDEEAQTRLAELILLNLQPAIQKVAVDGGNTWHRVRLGPYSDRRKLDQTRRKLQENGIDFFVVKEKKG